MSTNVSNQLFTGKVIMGGIECNLRGARKATKATLSAGTESTNKVTVTIKLLSENGTPVNTRTVVPFWLSTDANGDVIDPTGPSAIAIGTDGTLRKNGADSVVDGYLISEADGDIDVIVTRTNVTDTSYFNVAVGGMVFTSNALVFTS
jgi:hypothetical protein